MGKTNSGSCVLHQAGHHLSEIPFCPDEVAHVDLSGLIMGVMNSIGICSMLMSSAGPTGMAATLVVGIICTKLAFIRTRFKAIVLVADPVTQAQLKKPGAYQADIEALARVPPPHLHDRWSSPSRCSPAGAGTPRVPREDPGPLFSPSPTHDR